MFASWAKPVVDYANLKDGKLSIESFGSLSKSEQVHVYLDKLEKQWDQKKTGKGKNLLFMALLSSFKSKYINLLFWNTFTTFLELMSPFLIKIFIEYI